MNLNSLPKIEVVYFETTGKDRYGQPTYSAGVKKNVFGSLEKSTSYTLEGNEIEKEGGFCSDWEPIKNSIVTEDLNSEGLTQGDVETGDKFIINSVRKSLLGYYYSEVGVV